MYLLNIYISPEHSIMIGTHISLESNLAQVLYDGTPGTLGFESTLSAILWLIWYSASIHSLSLCPLLYYRFLKPKDDIAHISLKLKF